MTICERIAEVVGCFPDDFARTLGLATLDDEPVAKAIVDIVERAVEVEAAQERKAKVDMDRIKCCRLSLEAEEDGR